MSATRKVLLLEEAGAAPEDARALGDALRAEGASVRRLALAAPYDELLDALADGWLPVLLSPPASPPQGA